MTVISASKRAEQAAHRYQEEAMSRKSWTVGMMIPLAAATMVGTAPVASAKAVGVRASGRCTGVTHWTMKAKPDAGRIELELEIDSNRNGQAWAVRINDNRVRIFTGSRVTHAPSGQALRW
jgi:hypothetical protein